MVYKFRVILDAEEDIFRDIAILADDTLEDLHNAIFNSFGFDGMEVASFYTCDETWNQEDEISLLTPVMFRRAKTMSAYYQTFWTKKHKIIYASTCGTFLVGLAAVEGRSLVIYTPETLFSHGEMPDEAMEKSLKLIMQMILQANLKMIWIKMIWTCLKGDDSFEDFGFEENWIKTVKTRTKSQD
jgi:hypothetical protein